MRALRGCSTFVWLGWLALQLCVVAAPLLATALDDAPQAAAAESLCACPMGDDPSCPMHRDAAASADAVPSDAAPCTLRSTCTPLEYAIFSLQIGAAVLPDGVILNHDTTGAAIDLPVPVSIFRSTLPDLPPPRA